VPTYEYACKDCGQHIEVVQSFRDDPLQTCSNCQGRLRKVFSAAGIIFKGSGYYVTDTREGDPSGSDSSKPATSGSGASGGDSSGSDKASSDSSSTSDSSSASASEPKSA